MSEERRRRFLGGFAPSYPFTVATLRDHVYVGDRIVVTCPSGRREHTLDLIDLAERFGGDCRLDAVLERLRCARCGRKGRPEVTVVPDGDSRNRC